jgi:hypothetical protein
MAHCFTEMNTTVVDAGKLHELIGRLLQQPLLVFLVSVLLLAGGVGGGDLALTIFISLASLVLWAYYLTLVWQRSFRWRISGLLLGYLALIFCFATVYYSIYLGDHFAYSFSGDIVKKRTYQSFQDQLAKTLADNEPLFFLAVLDRHPDEGLRAVENATVIKEKDPEAFLGTGNYFHLLEGNFFVRFSLYDETVPIEHGLTYKERHRFLQVRRGEKTYTFRTIPTRGIALIKDDYVRAACLAKTLVEFHDALAGLMRGLSAQGDADYARLQEIMEEAQWSFVDFCYFSTITMTTVGYGDILPNSARVRAWVTLQCIIGVFYVGFALSLLWPSPPTKDPGGGEPDLAAPLAKP